MITNIIRFVFFILFLFSCNPNKQKIREIENISKEEKLRDRFMNKKLESINNILYDRNGINDKKIILIYTGFDCQSCVDKGFSILKAIKSQTENRNIYVISSNSNVGVDQERNDYYDFVYKDEQELIRQELKFLYTPIVLLLDKENRIKYIYFPKTHSDEKTIVEQLILIK